MMMEKYNEKRIQELMQETGAKRADLKRALGISNETTILRYVNGEDIHVSRLLQLASFFGRSVMDFFVRDGVVEEAPPAPSPSRSASVEKKLHEQEIAHLKEQMQLRIDYERRLAVLENENARLQEELQKKGEVSVAHPSNYLEKMAFDTSKVAETEDIR